MKSNTKDFTEKFIIALFILAISLPLIGTIVSQKQTISDTEKRKLAVIPDIHFNRKLLSIFPAEFELFFKDHFGFRSCLIIGHNYFKMMVLQKTELNNVVLGKNNWLYFRGDSHSMIDDYRGLISLEPIQLKAWKINFEQKRDWLAERGIKYLYVIAPSKVSIYPEYLPDHINRVKNNTMLDQLISYIKRYPDIEILDLRGPLLEAKKKELIYSPVDTHWNSKGGFVAYQQIMLHLKKWFPDISPIELSSLEQKEDFELTGNASLLNLEKYFKIRTESYQLKTPCAETFRDVKFDFKGIFKEKWHLLRSRCKKAPPLRAIVFRDSFFDSVNPFFAENFKEAIYAWIRYDQFVMEELLKNFKPDVVIEHVVERFMFMSTTADFNIHNMIAYDYLQKGLIKKAVHEYRAALELNPYSPDSYFNLGYTLLKDRKFDEALMHIRKALQIYPDHEKARDTLKRVEQFISKINSEISDVEKEVLSSPDDPNLLNKLAGLYLKKGESDIAISIFKKSLAIRPNNFSTNNDLALAYASKEDYDTAITFFKKAIPHQPEKADLYYNIACMYAKKKMPKQSTQWLSKALENGYKNWNLLQSDPDLEAIRGSWDYRNLLQAYGKP